MPQHQPPPHPPSAPLDVRTAVADLIDTVRRSSRMVGLDLLWIVAVILWSTSAVVGDRCPRLAARFDRYALHLESIADGDHEADR